MVYLFSYSLQIERIQNKALWAQYQAKKKQLEDENPPNTTNERLLWHGTAAEAVDYINGYGFNRSYCGKNGGYLINLIVILHLWLIPFFVKLYYHMCHHLSFVRF
jgi:hypothetical protein